MLSLISISIKGSLLLLLAGYGFSKLLKPEEARWIQGRPLAILVGYFLFALWSPNVWLVFAAEVIVIGFLSRSRSEAAAFYMLTLLSLPGLVREFAIGSVYLLPLDKLLFAALGLGVATIVRPRTARASGWVDVPMWLFFALYIVQARDLNFTSTLRAITDPSLTIALPYFLLSRAIPRAEDIRRLLLTVCFGAAVMSIVAFYEARTGWLIYDSVSHHLGLASGGTYAHGRGGVLRAGASFEEATTFGVFLGAALIAVLASRDVFQSNRKWMVAVGMLCLGLFAANARAGYLAAVLGVLAFDIYRRRYGAMIVKTGVIAGGLAVLLMAAQIVPKIGERFGLTGQGAGSIDYRTQLTRRGFEEIAKHPFFGVTMNEAHLALSDMRQGEGIVDFLNSYVLYGMTAGVPGILALAGCFLVMMSGMASRRRAYASDPQLLRFGGFVFATIGATIVIAWVSGLALRGGGFTAVIMAIFAAMCTQKAQAPRQASGSSPASRDRRPARSPTMA